MGESSQWERVDERTGTVRPRVPRKLSPNGSVFHPSPHQFSRAVGSLLRGGVRVLTRRPRRRPRVRRLAG